MKLIPPVLLESDILHLSQPNKRRSSIHPVFDRFRETQQLTAVHFTKRALLGLPRKRSHAASPVTLPACPVRHTHPYMSTAAIRRSYQTAALVTKRTFLPPAARPHPHLILPPALRPRSAHSSTTTAASKPPANTPQKKKKKPALTLEHFLLRQRVLGLYRSIVRGLQALPRGAAQREELRAYARGEFERHREVSDAGKIRYLVSMGKTEFDGMRRYLGEMGGR